MATKKAAAAAAVEPEQQQGTALAAVGGGDMLAEFDDVDFDGQDGLSEVDRDDLRIASKVLNMKGVDQAGKKIREDAFYDTVEERSDEQLDAVLLELHKTNLYSYYDQASGKTQRVCQSFDRVTGTMAEDGSQRPCKGCPDAQWRTVDGKRSVNCGPVYNVFAFDRVNRSPFVIRFRRTSLDVVKQYLQKHHIGRRQRAGGKLSNYPLFAFQCQISARMSDDGKYALPVLQRGEVLSREEMAAMMETARVLRENVLPILSRSDAPDDGGGHSGGEGGDTSFDTEAMDAAAAGGGGKKFVD